MYKHLDDKLAKCIIEVGVIVKLEYFLIFILNDTSVNILFYSCL